MRRPTIFAVVVAGVAVVGLVGWSMWSEYRDTYPTWQEEVQLSDGRVITVTQKHEYYENYGTNQSWVTFSLPEMGGERTWHSYLMPMRIDVVDGRVYAFGRPRGDLQVEIYRWPKHYLVAFQWNGRSFDRIPFVSVPAQIRATENVFPCVPKARAELVTWREKELAWCPPTGDNAQFGREIRLPAYDALALENARRGGFDPLTE